MPNQRPDIAKIRERAEKATAGPWERGGPWPSVTVIVCIDGGSCDPELPEPPSYEPICSLHSCGIDYETPPPEQAISDADFIAHARQDIPALLAENDELRGALRLARDELTRATWAKGADQRGLKYAIQKIDELGLDQQRPE